MKLFHHSPVNRRCGELFQFPTLMQPAWHVVHWTSEMPRTPSFVVCTFVDRQLVNYCTSQPQKQACKSQLVKRTSIITRLTDSRVLNAKWKINKKKECISLDTYILLMHGYMVGIPLTKLSKIVGLLSGNHWSYIMKAM